ncbi:MAG: type II toxin-antitoxin system prevent-host-death family antitoxin [Verrucomicrobiota bacterium JB022]|nr:type II toxin-antitoxin system prevent-host-death family antitoxin [Verrucomicrobiota bacterium JB022]
MEANLMDLRRHPGKILDALKRRERVILSKRGEPVGEIIPIDSAKQEVEVTEHPAFGMWKDQEQPVEEVVRKMRKSRFNDL